jgi:cell division protein FtsB
MPDRWDSPDGQTQYCASCEQLAAERDALKAEVAKWKSEAELGYREEAQNCAALETRHAQLLEVSAERDALKAEVERLRAVLRGEVAPHADR